MLFLLACGLLVSAMEAMQARLQTVSEHLRALSVERKGVIRQSRHVAKRGACELTFPAEVMRVALFIFEQSGWNLEPPCKFLQWYGRKKRCVLTDKAVAVLLEKNFLAADIQELLRGPVARSRDAERWLQEWRIVEWGRNLNMLHGVAPSTACLLEKARDAGDVFPGAIHARTRHGRPGRTARMWAHRFRKRWGAVIGKIKQNEYVPPDVLRNRVLILSVCGRSATVAPLIGTCSFIYFGQDNVCSTFFAVVVRPLPC